MNLGYTISELREARGLKQKDLAGKADITQAYLSQIENNKKEPNLSTIRILSEVLEVPVPLIFFLAMDENDIPEKKKEAFSMLRPLMKNLINDFFIAKEKQE